MSFALQLHMAKYINATGNGRRQIEALVGPTIHNNAAGATTDDPVVSLTFSCFGESVGLFGEDALWTDVMAGNANRISKAGGVMLDDDNSTLGLVAATILFYQARILPYIQGSVGQMAGPRLRECCIEGQNSPNLGPAF